VAVHFWTDCDGTARVAPAMAASQGQTEGRPEALAFAVRHAACGVAQPRRPPVSRLNRLWRPAPAMVYGDARGRLETRRLRPPGRLAGEKRHVA